MELIQRRVQKPVRLRGLGIAPLGQDCRQQGRDAQLAHQPFFGRPIAARNGPAGTRGEDTITISDEG